MSKILEFKPREEIFEAEQVSGKLKCFACKHEWQGVWSPGTTEFECPECGTFKGRLRPYDYPKGAA